MAEIGDDTPAVATAARNRSSTWPRTGSAGNGWCATAHVAAAIDRDRASARSSSAGSSDDGDGYADEAAELSSTRPDATHHAAERDRNRIVQGRVVTQRRQERWWWATGCADPGPGKAYELWLIDDAGAHAVRLLDKADDQTGAQGRRRRRFADTVGDHGRAGGRRRRGDRRHHLRRRRLSS